MNEHECHTFLFFLNWDLKIIVSASSQDEALKQVMEDRILGDASLEEGQSYTVRRLEPGKMWDMNSEMIV